VYWQVVVNFGPGPFWGPVIQFTACEQTLLPAVFGTAAVPCTQAGLFSSLNGAAPIGSGRASRGRCQTETALRPDACTEQQCPLTSMMRLTHTETNLVLWIFKLTQLLQKNNLALSLL